MTKLCAMPSAADVRWSALRPSAHALLLSVTSHITSHGPLCYGDWTLLILLNATDYNDAIAPRGPQKLYSAHFLPGRINHNMKI